MSSTSLRQALLWFYQFNVAYGDKNIFNIQNSANGIDFLTSVNDHAIGAQASYHTAGNMDNLIFQVINYGGGVDINLTLYLNLSVKYAPANDGVNTKIQALTFSNQPAIYSNTAAVCNDTTIMYPLSTANLRNYMPTMSMNVQYEWFIYYNMFQKYFPTSNEFKLSEDIT